MVDQQQSVTPPATQAAVADTVHVLHVDDDPAMASLTAEMLEREDASMDVETRTCTSDGLEYLHNHEVDCVVSDFDMPGKNGIEFLRAVRDSDRWADLPFVLFTGKGSEEVASDAISAGVSDYLQKESGTDQYAVLANRIDNLVRARHTEQSLEDRIEQQKLVARLGQRALANGDRAALFRGAVEYVSDALGTEFVKLLEYQSGADELLVKAGVGWREGVVGSATVDPGANSQAGYTLRSAEPVVVEHLPSEERFQGPWLLDTHGVVSGISVVVGDPDDPWGILGAHTSDRTRFASEDADFVQSVANVLASAIDRGERERRLRLFESAVEASGHSIYITDRDGVIEYVNPAFEERTGFTAEEALGATPRILKSGAHDRAFYADLWGTILDGETWRREVINETKDGDRYVVDQTIAPLSGADGEITHFVAVNAAISE